MTLSPQASSSSSLAASIGSARRSHARTMHRRARQDRLKVPPAKPAARFESRVEWKACHCACGVCGGASAVQRPGSGGCGCGGATALAAVPGGSRGPGHGRGVRADSAGALPGRGRRVRRRQASTGAAISAVGHPARRGRRPRRGRQANYLGTRAQCFDLGIRGGQIGAQRGDLGALVPPQPGHRAAPQVASTPASSRPSSTTSVARESGLACRGRQRSARARAPPGRSAVVRHAIRASCR